MEFVLTAEEMKACDREAIETGKASGEMLMDRASLGVARVSQLLLSDVRGKRVLALCGKGNNGGDGYGASLHLAEQGAEVRTVIVGNSSEVSGDAGIFLAKLRQLASQNPKVTIDEFANIGDSLSLDEYDLVIDAVLGTGLSDEPKGDAKSAINLIESTKTAVLAVDVPSGLRSNNGLSFGTCAKAVATATMGYVKRGLLMNEGKEKSGKIFVVDIGLPTDLVAFEVVETSIITNDDVSRLLPKRSAETHKHAVGKVFGLVGSVGLTGAGIMVGRAAMRAGAGAVVLGVPSGMLPVFASQLTEVMTVPLPQTGEGSLSLAVLLQVQKNLEWADVLAIGPGLSRNQETSQLIAKILRSHDGTIVVDADGLNAIADQPDILQETHADVILTPHHGEFSRLSGFSPEEIAADRVELARRFARDNKVTLVLKGAPTIVATKEGKVYMNVHGNPGMATAGSGDVLTGIIAALASQKLDPIEAAIAGVYLHSVSGDIAAEEKGVYSLIASDMIESLPKAFRKIINGEVREFERIA